MVIRRYVPIGSTPAAEIETLATERYPLGDRDPREVPVYGIAEAAHLLGMPVSKLRSWTMGPEKSFRPVIQIADPTPRHLSFYNLFEAYISNALRREHRISFRQLRQAIDVIAPYVDPSSRHPLAEHRFATIGVDLFIEAFGRLAGLKSPNQLEMRSVLESYLKRVDRDKLGKVARFYPFTRSIRLTEPAAPRVVVIDPAVMFGRPVIRGTRVTTAIVHQRWKAGEDIAALSEDYSIPFGDIEEALSWERGKPA